MDYINSEGKKEKREHIKVWRNGISYSSASTEQFNKEPQTDSWKIWGDC